MESVTLTVKPWKGPLYGKLAMKYEARCGLCGRPKPYQAGFYVRIIEHKGTTLTVGPLTLDDIDIDTHSDFDTVGGGCAKKLPAGYRVAVKAVERKFRNDY